MGIIKEFTQCAPSECTVRMMQEFGAKHNRNDAGILLNKQCELDRNFIQSTMVMCRNFTQNTIRGFLYFSNNLFQQVSKHGKDRDNLKID